VQKLHSTVNAPDFKWNRPWGFFVLTFTVVIREGLESVIFLTGVSGGEPISLILPGILGLLFGGFLGWLFFKGGSAINVTRFLVISSIFLFFIAAGLLTTAAAEFEEYAYLTAAPELIAQQDAILPQPIEPAESSPNVSPRFSRIARYARTLKRSADDGPPPIDPLDTVELPLTDDAVPIVAWTPAKKRVEANPACPVSPCTVRTYYIGAHEQVWNYAPSGYDHFNGMPFVRDPEGAGLFTLNSPSMIGAMYQKAFFYEFTDETFTARKAKPNWAEFMGPTLRVEVGDVLELVFNNLASKNYSMHPHGVKYTPQNEGAPAEWLDVGTFVEPNNTYTYTWSVPETSGPGPADGNSILWPYVVLYSSANDYTGTIRMFKKQRTFTLEWLVKSSFTTRVSSTNKTRLPTLTESTLFTSPCPTKTCRRTFRATFTSLHDKPTLRLPSFWKAT